MARLSEIVKFLDTELNVKKYNRRDYCINGLQHRGKVQINKIGFTVDASITSFKLAKESGCDLLITHHAAFAKDKKRYPEMRILKKRWLKENNLSVYSVHAPLDAHDKYGNNAIMMQMLSIDKYTDFGEIDGILWGKAGKLKKEKTIEEITKILGKKIPTKFKIFGYGKNKISKVAAVSGSSSACYIESIREKIDLLIVGDTRYSHGVNIQDLKLNVISGGHYKTEILGVKSLMPLIKETFKVNTIFIKNDIGL